MLKLNTSISSQINRSMVLSVIHRNPLISRALIAEQTGLDRSAITHILKELLERQLVEEVEEGKASARGGRRPVHLRVRHSARSLIAVEIGIEELNLAITDLAGTVLDRLTFRVKRRDDPMKLLFRAIEAARDTNPARFEQVIAIAVSCPGIIEHENGWILLNLYHNWRHINIKDPLEERFGKPVFLENDANAAALAEWSHHEAQGSGFDSLMYLMIRGRGTGPDLPLGIGGAFVQNGRLWHGSHHCSGEIAPAIVRRFTRILRERDLMDMVSTPDGQNALTLLMKAVEKGDRKATDAMIAISDVVGRFLAELAAFMDPDAIVICIIPPENSAPFTEALERDFRKHYGVAGLGRVRFVEAARQAEAALEGLVALTLEHVFIRDRTRPSLLFA
ncbi:MAG: hypothetical protein PWP23_2051 [Candidatus Sumerlaeota bacterium]|nr:hypothetical protein [Candidatus Sumerlaeota bacterium]